MSYCTSAKSEGNTLSPIAGWVLLPIAQAPWSAPVPSKLESKVLLSRSRVSYLTDGRKLGNIRSICIMCFILIHRAPLLVHVHQYLLSILIGQAMPGWNCSCNKGDCSYLSLQASSSLRRILWRDCGHLVHLVQRLFTVWEDWFNVKESTGAVYRTRPL